MPQILKEAIFPELPNYYRGKVRDNYDLPDGRRVIITTDRLSAFDRPICEIPDKGRILTALARYWFMMTAEVCPNHLLDYPDPNVLIVKRLRIFPVEFVMRDYLAGTTSTSVLSMYKAGQRKIYGCDYPDGLIDNQKLPWTVITPTTKGEHDEPIFRDEIIERGLMTWRQYIDVQTASLRLFKIGQETARKAGLILADTKYEFGLDDDDQIILADEIHTPDSSRYWFADTYAERITQGEPPDSFDKDIIRRWLSARCDPYHDDIPEIPDDLIAETRKTYADAYHRITGQPFHPYDLDEPIIDRVRRNVMEWYHTTKK